MHNLRELSLGRNPLRDLSSIENLAKIESLSVFSTNVSNIYPLKGLINLQSLDLSRTKVVDISALEYLSNLQSLDLCKTQVSNLRSLEELVNLRGLNLSVTKVSNINAVKKLSNLQELNLCETQVSDITIVGQLTGLIKLGISRCNISDIAVLKKLTNLRGLDVAHNKITDLSPILPLVKATIRVRYAESLYPNRLGLINDTVLCGNNPLANPPSSIVKEGREAVLEWFEQMEGGGASLYEGKLMILGQGGAGKTTLANLLNDPAHKVVRGKEKSTLGIMVHKNREFEHQKVEDTKIKAHLWDFGGQDIQKMLHQFFITDNCQYVLVSDKRAENTRFDYWFQIINLLGPKSSVVVLENPIDIDAATKDFPLIKYREQFKDLKISSCEVNLKQTCGKDKTNWQMFQEEIQNQMSELEIVNRKIPTKWVLVRTELTKLVNEKYITKDKFHEICDQVELPRKHRELCLFYLSKLGDLVYFDDRGLSNRIFLDHNWLTQGIYHILSDNRIKERKGLFTRKQAYDLWDEKGYNETEKEMLLNLLSKDKFDICYEVKGRRDHFITPLLLPDDKPERWNNEINLYFSYQYGFIPHGLFSRLIVRIHEKIDGEKRWATGVCLIDQYEGKAVKAEVQQIVDPEDNRIKINIKINGSQEGCKQLLKFVRDEVESLHKDFKNIAVKELIACSCAKCKGLLQSGYKPHFYEYSSLEDRLVNQKYDVECPNNGYKTVTIGQVISDVFIDDLSKKNRDSEMFRMLKESGVSMNNNTYNFNPKNELTLENVGNPCATSTSSANAEAKAEATSTVSIDIQNLLGDTEMLKEDIEDERSLIEKDIDADELDVVLKNIGKAEKAIAEIEADNKNGQAPKQKSKNRLKRFMDDLSDEKSGLFKTLKVMRKGKDYGVSLAKSYNNLAGNFGMPLVPPVALDLIEKL